MGLLTDVPDELYDDMRPREVSARALQKQLIDMYDFYYTHAFALEQQYSGEPETMTESDAYHIAKFDGGVEAVGGLYLYFFGGRAMLELDRLMELKIESAERGDEDGDPV